MNDEVKEDSFSKQMEKEFPKMFSKKYGGFEVGPGWNLILKTLCFNIQHHIDWKQEQKEKYQRGEGCPQVVVDQIKEKFGGLRFYYQGGDEYIQGMVRIAESWASSVCEECGERGKLRPGGWMRTLCDKHEEERQQMYKERFEE